MTGTDTQKQCYRGETYKLTAVEACGSRGAGAGTAGLNNRERQSREGVALNSNDRDK